MTSANINENRINEPSRLNRVLVQAERVRIIGWLLLCLALVFSTSVRLRLASFPMERDEGEYAYAGQLLLDGIPPYQQAYNMKLPGTYIAYAGILAVFGQSNEGIHVGMLVINLLTIGLVYRLTQLLYDEFTAGAAALIYAILSISATVQGMSAHATHFVTLFGLAATIVLWHYLKTSDSRLALVSGLLFGLAFLMKQQGVFLILFGGSFVLFGVRSQRSWFSCARWLGPLCFLLGVVTPYVSVCLWMCYLGLWNVFKFWTIDYATQYVRRRTWQEGLQSCVERTTEVIGVNFPLWILFVGGLMILCRDVFLLTDSPSEKLVARSGPSNSKIKDRLIISFVAAYLLFSGLCVSPALQFRPHYYVVLLAPISIFAGIACRQSTRCRPRSMSTEQILAIDPVEVGGTTASGGKFEWVLPVLVLSAGVIPTLLLQWQYLWVTSPVEICRRMYGVNAFVESPLIADYLRKNSKSSDKIAVLGSEPQIYFLSGRRACTGYLYTYPLLEQGPLAIKMQEEMIREIESGQPRYIVLVSSDESWARKGGDPRIFHWAFDYLRVNYQCVGLVDIDREKGTIARWDQQVDGYAPRSDHVIAVFRRS